MRVQDHDRWRGALNARRPPRAAGDTIAIADAVNPLGGSGSHGADGSSSEAGSVAVGEWFEGGSIP